jgi:hypothetical protein
MSFEFDYSMKVNVGDSDDASNLDDALKNESTDSGNTGGMQGEDWLDETIGTLEDYAEDLEKLAAGGDESTSKASEPDGEVTGDESLEELFADLGVATDELDDALDAAGNGESSSDLTPQEFMSQLNDVADESKGLTDGEKKMLDAGKGMINATPEQQQAFLDRAKSLAEDSGEIDDEQAANLSGFADGLMNDAAEGSTGADGSEETEDKSFMDQVDAILAQSQDGEEGPGEKMAREAAKLLEDNPEEDQKAFLAELEKMLNNKDGNGDHEKDIDEKNDGEGTMLKNMAEAFEELPSDRGDSSDETSSSESSSSENDAIASMLLDLVVSELASGSGDFDDAAAARLKSALTNIEDAEAEMT